MKTLERVYPWLLVSPVILPVIVWGGLIYPYLVPKVLLFYALSFVTVGAFVILAAHGYPFFWSRLARKEAWIPALLLVVAYTTSFFGIDFYRSFWSLLIRGDGLLMLTCAVASFYLILLYADRAFFDRLLRLVAVVGSFVAIYGIGEWLLSGGRIGSLLGNAAFFAGYLGIAVFATLIAARTLSSGWHRAAYVGAGFQIIAIVLTATRGTMLALFAAAIVALVHLAMKASGPKRVWSARFLALLALFIVAAFTFRSEIARIPFAPIARIASISTTETDVASRLFIWKNMVAEIQKNPLIGVGAEHIDTLFNRFYDPSQIHEEWFDRSHNAFFDYTVQYGIGGLALYLALILSFITTARRFARRDDRPTAGLFALLAITYAVQNFFVFDTVSSFWLLLALLASFMAVSSPDDSQELPLPAWMRHGSWAFAGVLVVLIIPVAVRPAQAAYYLAQAYAYQLVDVSREVGNLSHGIALGTYGDLEYGYQSYDMYANNQSVRLNGSARVDAYQAALSILIRNFNRYAYDARTALYLAHVLSLAPPDVPVDNDLLSAALERTIRLSPKRSQPWYVLVNLSISEANTHPIGSPERAKGYTAARDILTRYITLAPALAEPHFVLAELEHAAGDTHAAAEEAAKGRAAYTNNLETARRAVGYYESVSDWEHARFFLKEIVRIDPTDDLSRYDLAKVTYLTGDAAAAEEIVAALRSKNPALLETDPNFISAITAYEQSKK